MSKAQHEICTKECPSKDAKHHPDAKIISRKDSVDKWPHYTCPNCGFDTVLPEWSTTNAKKLLGEP
jgi:predicted RNA-binding Zn-ribbon protein involved in translation (DUF1610 family)